MGARRAVVGRTGSGPYQGQSYTVVPLVVRAASPSEAAERVHALLDEVEAVVGRFGGAELVSNLAECRDVARFALELYEGQIAGAVAEGARNQ